MVDWPRMDALDPDAVEKAFAFVTEYARERHPELDTDHGLLGDLFGRLHALMHASSRQAIADIRRALCTKHLALEPVAADEELLNALVSNAGITRQAVPHVFGRVNIILNAPGTVVCMRGAPFIAPDGTKYIADKTYVAGIPGPWSKKDDLQLVPVGKQWMFTVSVSATTADVTKTPKTDDLFVLETPPASFAKAVAASNFVGATSLQTNADLIALLSNGLAAKGFSSRPNIESLIVTSGKPEFADIQAVEIIGMGDKEMLRDKQDIFPIATGGCIDVYVRSRRPDNVNALLKQLQDFLTAEENAPPAANVKVKPANVCTITVKIATAEKQADWAPIAKAAADAVNSRGFTKTLYASTITTAVAPYVKGDITGVSMYGELICPNASTRAVVATDVLTFDDDLALGISAHTVAMYLDPEAVTPQ